MKTTSSRVLTHSTLESPLTPGYYYDTAPDAHSAGFTNDNRLVSHKLCTLSREHNTVNSGR